MFGIVCRRIGMEPFPRQLDDETLETLRRIHAELELDEHVSFRHRSRFYAPPDPA
jgi:hypothetical protein